MTTIATDGARPVTPAAHIPLPESPIFSYASTANRLSSYSLPLPPPPRPVHAVLSKADLEQSQTAYSDLITTAKSYRIALATLSTAASAFGSALESCARLKEARAEPLGPTGSSAANLTNSFTTKGSPCTADMLLGASGVHHLIANHQQILSETVYRSFEVPLLHELDKWRRDIEDEDETYRREAAQQSREIRRLEKEGLKLHRQRRRDVAKFREHLVTLTSHLDGLTTLHADHARTLLRESQETSVKILDASCSLVRAEVDIFEGLARKGWTGGGLDDLLERGRDLFASDEDVLGGVPGAAGFVSGTGAGAGTGTGTGIGAGEGARLFSILPPKSILADSASDSAGVATRPRETGRADSLLVGSGGSENDRYQSLAGAVDIIEGRDHHHAVDADSIFSEFNQSRGMRPFSPHPIRRRATDVIMDPEELLGEEVEHAEDESNDGGDGGGGESRDKNGDRREEADEVVPAPVTPTRETIGREDDRQHLENGDVNGGEEEGDGQGSHNNAAGSSWKDEGRGEESGDSRPSTGDGDDDKELVVLQPLVVVDNDNNESTAEERERRWNVTASDPGSP
ncbi:hypothetical protein F5X96DRAFT_645783 [Biscogniauxia mediterranea]|nr:hypothetical protein F5X96DRAFT_645783 [Biscogniauxia mediterranea]